MSSAVSAILRMLKEGDGFVSGTSLCQQLGVSRTAVWKKMELLRNKGYCIEAVPSRGYRLLSSPDFLDESALSARLSPGCLVGRRLVCSAETTSTNTDAFRLAEAGAEEGTVVLADCQSSGKGRLGRRWESPTGVNLYCSVILRPDLMPHEASQLTFVSAVAVARAIEGSCRIAPTIKWPNDLLVGGKKVAGLLNEMSAETDRVAFVILGIGVNLNMSLEQFPDDLRYPASSLMLESGVQISRADFAASLFRELDEGYARFKSDGFAAVREEWSLRCNAFGRNLVVDTGSSKTCGSFAGIDHDGALLLQLPEGTIERIISGDVTVC